MAGRAIAGLCNLLVDVCLKRLWLAPDCGLGLLGCDLARAKLKVLAAAAHSL